MVLFSFLASEHVIADTRAKHAEGLFYTLVNHRMLIDILIDFFFFPSPEHSSLSSAFSNLLITMSSSR